LTCGGAVSEVGISSNRESNYLLLSSYFAAPNKGLLAIDFVVDDIVVTGISAPLAPPLSLLTKWIVESLRIL
jgi:hypothetical protein